MWLSQPIYCKRRNDEDIERERIILRPISMEDLDWIFEDFKSFEFRKFLGMPVSNLEITKEGEKKWLEDRLRKISKGDLYLFVIQGKELKEPIGLIKIRDINWHSRVAKIGYWIRKSHWGRDMQRGCQYNFKVS